MIPTQRTGRWFFLKVKTPEVVSMISERMGCFKRDCRMLLDYFADLVVRELAAGRSVYYKPLGTFHVVRGRDGRRRVRFLPAKRLRLMLRGAGEVAQDEACS